MNKNNEINLLYGKSIDVLPEIPDNSVDSIVTDPPYGIGFMGKDWDKTLPSVEIWKECMRVLKPGGYLVAMSSSRTYHRLAVQLEDIGLICHPMIGWIYGSGFPKATDLSKQLDKNNKTIIGKSKGAGKNPKGFKSGSGGHLKSEYDETIPTTDLAKKWNGYKYGLQALKPALEPIAVFQKPWKCKDVKKMTENVEKWECGAFNIDACRVDTIPRKTHGDKNIRINGVGYDFIKQRESMPLGEYGHGKGRHPANLLHDGSESVETCFPSAKGQQGNLKNNNSSSKTSNCYGEYKERKDFIKRDDISSNASRFFNKLPITDLDAPFLYQAKPSKKERGEANNHPTVKPIALMEWLIKLVTPEGGVTVDPFMGSGTSGIAAIKNGFKFIGVEKEKESFDTAQKRINNFVVENKE